MAYEHQENKGSMFVNDYKRADNHPDYKGQINVEGKLFDIAGWKSNKVDGMLSLSVNKPYKLQPESENESSSTEKKEPSLEDEVKPF